MSAVRFRRLGPPGVGGYEVQDRETGWVYGEVDRVEVLWFRPTWKGTVYRGGQGMVRSHDRYRTRREAAEWVVENGSLPT